MYTVALRPEVDDCPEMSHLSYQPQTRPRHPIPESARLFTPPPLPPWRWLIQAGPPPGPHQGVLPDNCLPGERRAYSSAPQVGELCKVSVTVGYLLICLLSTSTQLSLGLSGIILHVYNNMTCILYIHHF